MLPLLISLKDPLWTFCQKTLRSGPALQRGCMHKLVSLVIVVAVAAVNTVPAVAVAGEMEFDPLTVDVVDALECRLDPRTYNGFAFTIGSDDSGYRARGWKRRKSNNPFLSQYELPKPITIAGHRTRTVVFSSTAIMAVLDADLNELARHENIENAMDASQKLGASRKFLGERVISSKSETDNGLRFASTVKRVLSNVTSHPTKALLGCSYSVELKD